MGVIYKITNHINQKIYIGKTSFDIEKRWKKHLYEARRNKLSYALYIAMRKYGIENFSITTIEEVEDSLLSERESYWINYYDSFIKNGKGYNETLGGEGNPVIDRRKIEKLWDKGNSIKQICDILGNDRSSIRNILSTYKNYSKRESNKRGDSIQASRRFKRVHQYDLKGKYIATYKNLHDAERHTGISHKTIWGVVNHKYNNAGGFQWRYEDDDSILENIESKSRKYKQTVLQFDLNDNFIKEYSSAAEASRETGINSIGIRNVCKGKNVKAGGYKWRYKEGGI